LVDYSTGRRRVLNNPTKEAAERRADGIRKAMVKGQANRLSLSNGQWQDVCIAHEILRNTRTADSLTTALQAWAECLNLLDGRASLQDAVRCYLANQRNTTKLATPTSFSEASTLYIDFKVKSKLADSHCGNLRSRLRRMATNLPPLATLSELTARQLDAVVVGLNLKEKTRNEYREVLSGLYKSAGKQNPPLVSPGFNPASEMDRHKVRHQEVQFLCVPELANF
jgi:hypothetical protein